MTRSQIYIDRPPEAVWRTISDPYSYERWLVGCKAIRSVDAAWPRPDSRFHHRVGLLGPLTVKDSTKVIDSLPEEVLLLEARARPAGIASVRFELAAKDGGTELSLSEAARGRLVRWIWGPLVDLGIRLRNERSLGRLKSLLESAG
jgi:uncharacterized protein YndB with AHSA1/START domain